MTVNHLPSISLWTSIKTHQTFKRTSQNFKLDNRESHKHNYAWMHMPETRVNVRQTGDHEKQRISCLFSFYQMVTRHKRFLIKFRKFSLFHQINAMVTWNQAQRKGPPDQRLTPRTINHESKRHWLTNLVESSTRVFTLYLRYNAVS